jgi:hypothetical protein
MGGQRYLTWPSLRATLTKSNLDKLLLMNSWEDSTTTAFLQQTLKYSFTHDLAIHYKYKHPMNKGWINFILYLVFRLWDYQSQILKE